MPCTGRTPAANPVIVLYGDRTREYNLSKPTPSKSGEEALKKKRRSDRYSETCFHGKKLLIFLASRVMTVRHLLAEGVNSTQMKPRYSDSLRASCTQLSKVTWKGGLHKLPI